MSISGDILEYLKRQRSEERFQQLMNLNGYSNPQVDEFGLNKWTCRLSSHHSFSEDEKQDTIIDQPCYLVSFLIIPMNWDDELIDTNSKGFPDWISEYKWKQIHRMDTPFPSSRAQACSEGLLLPKWIFSSELGLLELFLLFHRTGVIEFGIGKEAYFVTEKGVGFKLIQIIGRLWQFLDFMTDFYERFNPNYGDETILLVNLRGTKNALLGNLAEGWKEPAYYSSDPYNPKCLDKHLQIRRKISPHLSANEIEETIHWFATRIDNAWGQFEPRCYVHRKFDETQPFARREPK